MIEIFKKVLENLKSLIDKIKCSLSCCSSTVNIRVFERKKTME